MTTSWPVDIQGSTDLTSDEGVSIIRPGTDLAGLRLEGEKLVIDHAWQRGIEARVGEPLGRHVMDQDDERHTLLAAEAQFDFHQDDPVFMVYPGKGPMDLYFYSDEGYTTSSVVDETILAVGTSPDRIGTGESADLGLWYTVEGPASHGQGTGNLRVEGSFTVFVHDVIIDAVGTDSSWYEWTGYSESNPDQVVTEYELRLTKIHVENGTFVAPSETIELFLPSFEAHMEGTLFSTKVTGRLLGDAGTFIFDRDPIRLQGSGPVSVQAMGAPGQESWIYLNPSGDFGIEGASMIEPAELRASDRGSIPAWVLIAGAGTLVVAAIAGLMGRGTLPIPESKQNGLYAFWLKQGRKKSDANRWSQARRCYANAVRIKPDAPLGWYEWAYMELESGDATTSERIARKAVLVPGADPMDLLDLRACAAWERNDIAAFEKHLSDLAETSREMACGIVDDLEIDLSVLSGELRCVLERTGPEGYLEGYV